MRYCTDTCAVELSVDELCALAHQSGHLDARRPRRAQQKAKILLPINCSLPPEKGRCEDVSLRNTTTHNGITYTVEGVADAVCEEGALIEEKLLPAHPEIEVLKVDVDEDPALAAKFGVMSIPTLLLYKDGKFVEQIVGLTKPDVLAAKLA